MNDTFAFSICLPHDAQHLWYAIHGYLKGEVDSYRLVGIELSESPEARNVAIIKATVPRHIHQGFQSYVEMVSLQVQRQVRDIVLNYLPAHPAEPPPKTVWERLLGDDSV